MSQLNVPVVSGRYRAESEKQLGAGEEGKNEDDEYFDLCQTSERLATSVAERLTSRCAYDRIMVSTILKRVIAFTA